MKNDMAYLERIFANLSQLQAMLKQGHSQSPPPKDDDLLFAICVMATAQQIGNHGS